jgi:hypothetical protein
VSEGRLTASVEATGLIRRIQADGGFAAVLHKGDADRGALLLVIRSRGAYVTCLERTLGIDGVYRWSRTGSGETESAEELADFLKKRISWDPDLWLIELDIAQPERFNAETTGSA